MLQPGRGHQFDSDERNPRLHQQVHPLPHYNEKMVNVPAEGFQFNLPGNQHGIPSKAKEIRLKIKAEEERKYEV